MYRPTSAHIIKHLNYVREQKAANNKSDQLALGCKQGKPNSFILNRITEIKERPGMAAKLRSGEVTVVNLLGMAMGELEAEGKIPSRG
jgi:hypothetical protein